MSVIFESNVVRPSGLVPGFTLARQSWVCAAPSSFVAEMKRLDAKTRFSIYREIDVEVMDKYIELLRTNNAKNIPSDLEGTMMTAGDIIASTLNQG